MFPERDTPAQRRKSYRSFGLLVGGILALIGLWQWFRGRHEIARIVLGSIGGVLIVFGAVAPMALRPVHAVWMKLAHLLGWVNARVILTAVYYLVLTPAGLVARMFGRDPMDRRIDAEATTYWKPRKPVESIQEHAERPY